MELRVICEGDVFSLAGEATGQHEGVGMVNHLIAGRPAASESVADETPCAAALIRGPARTEPVPTSQNRSTAYVDYRYQEPLCATRVPQRCHGLFDAYYQTFYNRVRQELLRREAARTPPEDGRAPTTKGACPCKSGPRPPDTPSPPCPKPSSEPSPA